MINPVYEPYQAAAWLAEQWAPLAPLLRRVGCVVDHDEDTAAAGDQVENIAATSYRCVCGGVHPRAEQPFLQGEVDLDQLAQLISDVDIDQGAGVPLSAYEREEEGQHHAYAVMSGGEQRALRMLATLSPGKRVRFNLGDTVGVDAEYVTAWRQLVAGDELLLRYRGFTTPSPGAYRAEPGGVDQVDGK